MLVFKFDVNPCYLPCFGDFWNRYAFEICVYDVPTAAAFLGNAAILDVREQPLMKIADVIIIRFVALPINLGRNNLFPRQTVNHLVEDEFDRVDLVLVEAFDFERLKLT